VSQLGLLALARVASQHRPGILDRGMIGDRAARPDPERDPAGAGLGQTASLDQESAPVDYDPATGADLTGRVQRRGERVDTAQYGHLTRIVPDDLFPVIR